jgi:two-component system sensor histidine kinase/response regulator
LGGIALSPEAFPMALAVKERKAFRGPELILERPDGTRRNIIPHPQPIYDDEGNLLGASNVITDITEHKKDDLEVINSELYGKNEELKKRNQDLDNFIYIASHDLKVPISNIEGLITTLSEMINEENPSKETLNEVLQMMEQSIARFSNTINDLTTITKVQKDIEEETPEKVDLLELIEDIKLINGDLIANSGARIYTARQDMQISFSRKNLKSILHNLITNAIKYRSPARTPEIHISMETKPPYKILKIKDNGLGLEDDKQAKLFSMFRRFHDHVEGTGIGLYLVKRIITNAGGKIEVESIPAQGSTFSVFFKESDV